MALVGDPQLLILDESSSGLGLTYVTHLAELYEWEVAITAGEGGGTRVEFSNVEFETPTTVHRG